MPTSSRPRPPAGLAAAGRALWRKLAAIRDLNAGELVVLLEACRLKDRLDRFDRLLRGDKATWVSLELPQSEGPLIVQVTSAVTEARLHAAALRQLIDSLHLAIEEVGPVAKEVSVDPLAAARNARAARKARASGQ